MPGRDLVDIFEANESEGIIPDIHDNEENLEDVESAKKELRKVVIDGFNRREEN